MKKINLIGIIAGTIIGAGAIGGGIYSYVSRPEYPGQCSPIKIEQITDAANIYEIGLSKAYSKAKVNWPELAKINSDCDKVTLVSSYEEHAEIKQQPVIFKYCKSKNKFALIYDSSCFPKKKRYASEDIEHSKFLGIKCAELSTWFVRQKCRAIKIAYGED